MFLSQVICLGTLLATMECIILAVVKRRFRRLFKTLAVLCVVISLVPGFIWFARYKTFICSRTSFTASDFRQIANALGMFEVDVGRLPAESEGLIALVNDPGLPNWQGPYVTDEFYHERMLYKDEIAGELQETPIGPKGFWDYWSNHIYYVIRENEAFLISSGPNGRLDSDIPQAGRIVQRGDDIFQKVHYSEGG